MIALLTAGICCFIWAMAACHKGITQGVETAYGLNPATAMAVGIGGDFAALIAGAALITS